ncbi:glycerophosphocholine phosphodiesterase GPCPD1 [Genypterus blacodes]|uniref:glycerophosphocholine phosphodiesterase GPCPD1 n=1 Tax=Genypterus blacodes TaxID=154954 RepID=UPI003F759CCB
MESQVTLTVRGDTSPGEVIAVVGSCEALGNWSHQRAVTLRPACDDGSIWSATVALPRGVVFTYRYFKGFFLESKMADGPCQVIVNVWETHQQPRTTSPTAIHLNIDDGLFGVHNGLSCVDAGWLTCQTEIRLRLHHSKKPPVSITKKKYKKSRFRIKLTLEGVEEEEDEEEEEGMSPSSLQKMTTTLGMSMISSDGYKSRHSQPECGYALEPAQWTEYSIHTMDPDNLELIFEFFEEDLSEHVVQGDTLPGHVGTACLLSSTFAESGKDIGEVTLPIMGRNSRQTIGKVRVDYLVMRPIWGQQCDMSSSYTKYWKKRSTLVVGHRGAGSTHAAKHHRVRENTIASFKSAANHGAAYVEFDVHLSKDAIPIVYHDLTCCIATKKKKNDTTLELLEVPVKDLTFDQLQLLKLAATTASDHKDLMDDEDEIDEYQPFPSLTQIFHAVPEDVGFNIELKWISQMKDGSWDGNMSSYFNMNAFLDIVLSCVLRNAGRRRIVFSCFDPDVCTMVRNKQNKFPILFLTQGISEKYPELMDVRCQTTQIAMSFAQSENILGISAHTEELLKNLHHIREAQSKGLVVFSWGEDNNDHETRKMLREQGIDGLIYDRICEDQAEQSNIFKVEEQHSLQEVITEETRKSSSCSCYSIPCSMAPCVTAKARAGSAESDSGLSSS